MFENERMAGIRFTMLADLVNVAASEATIKYWDGDSWAACSNVVDGTLNSGGTKSFNQSGLISWTPPALGSEFPYTIGDRTGYTYQISFSGTITGTHGDTDYEVVVDLISGVPAPIEVGPYKFHSTFRGRHFGCGFLAGKEGNRVDFTPPHAPDVWNGAESSMNGLQSIYFGTDEDLTCGAPLFNRYGSQVFEVWVGFTASQMFVLKGDGPEDWANGPDTVSSNIGCPAPYTLVATATGYEDQTQGDEQLKRFALIWVSAGGPFRYDGNTIDAIPGLERYFDPNDSLYVGADLTTAYAWYDPIYKEYNLRLPGSVWVTYDLERKRWFQKSTGAAKIVNSAFNVIDSNGYQYVYGGLDNGYMMRLEYGNSWDGTGIVQKLVTGDFWPSENIWHVTLIKDIKLVAKQISEDHAVQILYQADTSSEEGASYIWRDNTTYSWRDNTSYEWRSPSLATLDISQGTSARLLRKTVNQNLTSWSHAVGFQVTTDDTNKGFQPIGWGIRYEVIRDDD
jgi:hypothetical protein